MLFLGHIAASLLVADATGSDRTAAVAGNLVPDVIDKTASRLLKLTPASRWLAHGLPSFALFAALSFLALDRRRWRGFVLGYAGHLVCDLWAGGRVPWFAPFERQRRPDKLRGKRRTLFLLPEVVGAPIIWLLLSRPRTTS
jgi:hypothetical protein